MPTSRKPLSERMDARRAAQAVDPRVAALETDVAALRQREQMYRVGWRAASAARDQARGEALVYRRAARRRYKVMLRLAGVIRRERDHAKAARGLVMRYRERWNEALLDGERFRQETHTLRARADRWRDRCKNRTAERDTAVRDAQDARNALGEALRERDQAREELRAQLAMPRSENGVRTHDRS